MHKKWNMKRIALWIFLIMQISLVMVYWLTQNENTSVEKLPNLKSSVAFIKKTYNNVTTSSVKYFQENSRIVLKTEKVETLYEDFNTSLCYKSGTDIKLMKKSKDMNWKCVCLRGWHGNDCGQPEVIWRALLASRKGTIIPATRKSQRRIIHFSEINILTTTFTEITLYELKDVVDLFIICDLSNSIDIKNKFKTGFLNDIYRKILYINGANRNDVWKKATKTIRNLRDDDIFFINNPYEVPNAKALQFLKLYNDWPQPLTFRLRWSVYGFFWKHPQATILTSGACTLKYLFEALDNDVEKLKKIISNDLSSKTSNDKQGFIIGDLNHFGGWFCEYCNDPASIIESLNLNLINNSLLVLDNVLKQKIDVAYIEDLIENGVYLDGKTELIRAHRSNENYYAPNIVSNNNWKYDYLLLNLYSKMDYY